MPRGRISNEKPNWRFLIGNGTRAVGLTDWLLLWSCVQRAASGKLLVSCAGAINGVVPLDEVRGKLIGRLSKEEYELAANLGWPTDPGGCGQGWVHRDGVLRYAPTTHSVVVPATSDEFQLIARSRPFSF